MANALLKGTFSSEDVTKYLPGDNFSRCKTGSVKAATLKKNKTGDPSQQFALVYFIGGKKSKKSRKDKLSLKAVSAYARAITGRGFLAGVLA